MKNMKVFLLGIVLMLGSQVWAQHTVTGVVIDRMMGEGMPDVDVVVKGTANSTTTDAEGNFSLEGVNDGDVVEFEYLGYATVEETISGSYDLYIEMEEGALELTQVVAIGYGVAKKEDVSGAVDLITSEDFNKGPITSPQELISGKIAGVSVTTGGAPGDDANINIRGLSSLSLTSQPLIVVDGVPLDNNTVGGARNPLNMINPSDIESMTVLKDASATAIFGARSANGVIMITTKKGKNKGLKFNYNNAFSISEITRKVDVMSASQFSEVINGTGNENAIGLLGNADTDWQDLIYDAAMGVDNNLSAMGRVLGIPARFSVGHTYKNGVLHGDNIERFTGSVNLSPQLLNGDLKLDLNARGMYTENTFANRGAIGAALAFDPTQSAYNADGSFYASINPVTGVQYGLATTNPLALLAYQDDTSEVRRFVGNAKIDYTLPFFRDVTLTLNGGYDKTNSHGRNIVSADMPSSSVNYNGNYSSFRHEVENKLFDAYVTYAKTFGENTHDISLMAGHSYQSFDYYKYSYNNDNLGEESENYDPSANTMLSYFGRLNYTLLGKYSLTATLRADASSKLISDNRWGYFPSAAFAWNIHKEGFLADSNVFKELKLRVGYGEVGNVNGLIDYQYLTRYTASQPTADYQFGDIFYTTFRPEPINRDLKWEVGNTINVGLDYALFNNVVSGSLNAYVKKTKDLIAYVDIDPFTNFGNSIDKNIGDMKNSGIEFSVNLRPIKNENLEWNIGYNISYNDNEITNLSGDIPVGGISGGTGNTVQVHREGYAPYSFLVYQQVYDDNGTPLEGVYVDRNDDGQINSDDRYIYKDPYADILMGLNTSVVYKNWDLSVVTRASIGNYMYNNVASSNGYLSRALPLNGDYLTNIHTDYLNSEFTNITDIGLQSDYYITNASFFKVDNITLGYTLQEGMFRKMPLRIYGSLQNVAVITDYEGIDPEVLGGIDNDFYPRPRTFVLGVNFDF